MTDFISLMSNNQTFFFTVTFIFSLMIGSFLNVIIFRFPKMLEQGWKRECREFLADEGVKSDAVDNDNNQHEDIEELITCLLYTSPSPRD